MKNKAKHCDGYYNNGVCPHRGEQDPADIRYDQEGWIRRTRHICKTDGYIEPEIMELCSHCVEYKKYFRQPPRHHSIPIIYVTPFQAKHQTSDAVVRAFETKAELQQYLADHPYDRIYGENILNGEPVLAKPSTALMVVMA